jgi:dipeptidyl-peptidase-4
MFIANPASTVSRLILTEQAKYFIDYRLLDDIYFFSDNSGFLYVSERDGFRHVYRYRMTGILDRQLTSGSWDVTTVYGFDERNNILYFQSAETSPLQRNVYSLDARGRTTRLTPENGTNNAMFNSTFTYYINNFSNLETPNRITLHTSRGAQVRVLEDNALLAQRFNSLNLPKKEFFTFKTSENVELNGWIVKPKNFNPNTKYPVLMVQYSGPDTQEVRDRWRIDWEYYLAENGYIVAAVDGRGTGARGVEFRNSTYMQLGILETKDQIEAAKYLGRQSYVDESRIGIWGWSYGGTITLLSMSSGEQVFKTGISVAPVTDWRLYNTVYTERFMRRPQENFRGYEITSPLLQAQNLQGRLLIIHGTADDNVHAQNTMLYTDRLMEAGIQFEMQLYTDKCHSLLGQQTRRHLFTRKSEFLFRNL